MEVGETEKEARNMLSLESQVGEFRKQLILASSQCLPMGREVGRRPTIQLLLNGVHPMRDFVLKRFHMGQQVKLPLVLGAQEPLSTSVQQLLSRCFLW